MNKITKQIANREVIIPLKNKYNIKLVGSISKKGYSYKDIDILLTLPLYPESDKIFIQFEYDLKKLGWVLGFDDYNDEYGIFHNYKKIINKKIIGLDIFINEKLKRGYKMDYVFGVRATDKHDGEVAVIKADNLEEAKARFAEDFPEDINNIECITSDRGYEYIN